MTKRVPIEVRDVTTERLADFARWRAVGLPPDIAMAKTTIVAFEPGKDTGVKAVVTILGTNPSRRKVQDVGSHGNYRFFGGTKVTHFEVRMRNGDTVAASRGSTDAPFTVELKIGNQAESQVYSWWRGNADADATRKWPRVHC